MTARKLSVSLPDGVAEAAIAAAAAEGVNLSAWLTAAARDRLRLAHAVDIGYRSALELVIEHETLHGQVPEEANAWAEEAIAAAGLQEKYRRALGSDRAVG